MAETINIDLTYGDTSMPFGKYSGYRLSVLPPKYLLWLWHECELHGDVRKYIRYHLDRIMIRSLEFEKWIADGDLRKSGKSDLELYEMFLKTITQTTS